MGTMCKETGFVIVDVPKNRKEELLGGIKKLSWLNENSTVSVLRKLEQLDIRPDQESFVNFLFIKEISTLFKTDEREQGSYEAAKKGAEKVHQMITLIEQYLSKDIITTYGIFAPSYISELSRQNFDKDYQHRALLIGAESAKSFQEFNACVKYVFPKAECSCLDIDPFPELGRCPLVKKGDVFNMKDFGDNSFDSIHTNYLFSGLVKGHYSNMNRLWSEMFRVLKPEGKLILVELRLDEDVLSTKFIERSGFKNIVINKVHGFSNRNDLDIFMRSSHGNVDVLNYQEVKNNELLITATK